jgi:hypothetical protein
VPVLRFLGDVLGLLVHDPTWVALAVAALAVGWARRAWQVVGCQSRDLANVQAELVQARIDLAQANEYLSQAAERAQELVTANNELQARVQELEAGSITPSPTPPPPPIRLLDSPRRQGQRQGVLADAGSVSESDLAALVVKAQPVWDALLKVYPDWRPSQPLPKGTRAALAKALWGQGVTPDEAKSRLLDGVISELVDATFRDGGGTTP